MATSSMLSAAVACALAVTAWCPIAEAQSPPVPKDPLFAKPIVELTCADWKASKIDAFSSGLVLGLWLTGHGLGKQGAVAKSGPICHAASPATLEAACASGGPQNVVAAFVAKMPACEASCGGGYCARENFDMSCKDLIAKAQDEAFAAELLGYRVYALDGMAAAKDGRKRGLFGLISNPDFLDGVLQFCVDSPAASIADVIAANDASVFKEP